MKANRRRNKFLLSLTVLAVFLLLFYAAQRFFAHRAGYFIPEYPQITLNETTDYETIFLQTGLGRSAVNKLLDDGRFHVILAAQEAFFHPPEVICTPLLGWFTREDRLVKKSTVDLVDLQPGDILLTLSTHTAGWHHGHAGLAIDENTVLESIVLGSDSTLINAAHWTAYSNYAVLRPKSATPELQQMVATYSTEHLLNIPYRLSAGLLFSKAPEPNSILFGTHCSYLVWYAWNQFGYDLDSDGGRLVTTYDLLCSDLLEVVQLHGIDPRIFS